MLAPVVASDSDTLTELVYVPGPGLIAGVATTGWVVPEVIVQVMISWVATEPPTPPPKPTYAVFAPTTPGIFSAVLVVNVALVTVSVMVMVSVVPSYTKCTAKISPLCRLIPVLLKSVAGTVGDAPLL